jgi:hypothetical protein
MPGANWPTSDLQPGLNQLLTSASTQANLFSTNLAFNAFVHALDAPLLFETVLTADVLPTGELKSQLHYRQENHTSKTWRGSIGLAF